MPGHGTLPIQLLVNTTDPPLPASRRAAASPVLKHPVRLVSIWSDQIWGVISRNGAMMPMPALPTTPVRFGTAAKAASTCAKSRTSACA